VRLDFLQFGQRSNLEASVITTLINGYNATPPNFQCPSDAIIQQVIEAVEHQIAVDQQAE